MKAPKTIGRLRSVMHDEISSRRSSRTENPLNDCLDFAMNWLDEHSSEGYTDWNIVDVIAELIVGSLHTSSQVSFDFDLLLCDIYLVVPCRLLTSVQLIAHLVYEFATRPDYVQSLREEMEECFAEHGEYTKKALDAMVKMDSFMKETQRTQPLDACKDNLALFMLPLPCQ